MGYKDVRSGHQPGFPGQQRVMEGCSKELQQLDEVESLLLELRNSKETNAVMKKELETYQGVIKSKRLALDALNGRLEDIKVENERMAVLLKLCHGDGKGLEGMGEKFTCGDEASCHSAHTGSKSTVTPSFPNPNRKAEQSKHNEAVDHFLRELETTVLRLQECFQDHR